MKIQLLFIGLLTILSCSTKKDTRTELKPGLNIIYKREVLHNFSSPIKKDSFKIIVTGQSIVSGQFRFQITNSSGQIIWNETYPTNSLFGYGFIKTDSTDSTGYLTNRIDGYFDENNFYKPAISVDDKFHKDYSDKGIWDEIKSDKEAIGFRYLIGKRDGRQIAFSKNTDKVVLYFKCCE